MTKKSLSILSLVFTFLLVFSGLAYGQTRGVGVGALATRNQSGTLIEISSGKTAPWAEVIAETGSGEIEAVAEIDSRGVFSFSYFTQSAGDIYLYAVDELGVTNKVHITSSNYNNFILPPTIVSVDEDTLPDDSVRFKGFSYPGAEVRVSLSSEAYDETVATTADSSSGEWSIEFMELPGGSYTATALASSGGTESQNSQEIYFDIEKGISKTVKDISKAGQEVARRVRETVENLPEPARKTSNVVSKAAAPVAASFAFIQVLLTGLSLKDLFSYLTLAYFWLTGIIKRRKKEGRWGVVYDSVTKNPLSGVIVRLYSEESGELIETDVTGAEGVFSFLPKEGTYRVEVAKPGYDFPSGAVEGEVDGEYTSVYLGGSFKITSKMPIVELSIPIDPRSYKEVVDFKIKVRRFFGKYSSRLAMLLFAPGFIFSSVTYISNPITLNRTILIFYIVGLLFYVTRQIKLSRFWGVVYDEKGDPLPNISLSLVDTTFERQLQRRVTDASGRYQFVAPAGSYKIVVTSDGYEFSDKRKGYKGEVIDVKKDKNVIKEKIVLKGTSQKSFAPDISGGTETPRFESTVGETS